MTKTDQAGLPFQLDLRSGVPVYRQIMDQVLGAVASGRLTTGDQLPTVRQLAVDLSINPNTVIRAYRELEIRGFLDTHQGSGTFITPQPVQQDNEERQRKLDGMYLMFAIQVAKQWEKAAVLRLGRYRGLRGPGPFLIVPIIDSVSRYVD